MCRFHTTLTTGKGWIMKKKFVITAVAAVALAATVGVTTHVSPFLASEVDLDVSDDSDVLEGDIDFEDTGSEDVDLSEDLTLDDDSEVIGDTDFDNADDGAGDNASDSAEDDAGDGTGDGSEDDSSTDFTDEDFAGDFEDVDLDGEFGDDGIDDEFGDFDVDFDDDKDTTKKDKDKKDKDKTNSNSGKKKKNEPTVVTSNQADGGDPAGKGTNSSKSSSASLPKTGKSSPFDAVTDWFYQVIHSILN